MSPPNERSDLPILSVIDEVINTLTVHRRAIIVAPPGAGKTTLVPIRLMESPAVDGRILVLEPRRLATRAAAQRMAALVGCTVGDTVGYTTRDERRAGASTRIEVVTEGILTRRIQNDASLPGVAAVLFDEVHERHLTTDLGLALALEVADTVRPDLIIGAMSATPDTDRLRRVMGDCRIVDSDGSAYPVDIVWAPGSGRRQPGSWRDIHQHMTATIVRALSECEGDVLAFLPGMAEIQRTARALADVLGPGIDIRPLAGAISLPDQDLALAASPDGRRRVVLATDIAESSLTVDGIRIVVDAGLARVPRHDPRTGMTRLTTITASRASADQRAGRAGRVAPGSCYRLWSPMEHGSRPAHRTPEIADADLAGFVLEALAWGTPINEMRLLTAPSTGQLRSAESLLADIGAIDEYRHLTETGRQMLALPMHPRLAAMVVRYPDPLSLVLAALLDERDIYRGHPDEIPSDIDSRVLAVITRGRSSQHADQHGVRRVAERAEDLARRLDMSISWNDIDPSESGRRLLAAFPERLAGRRRSGQFQLRSGSAAWVPESDPLANEELIIAVDLDGRRDRARIRQGCVITLDDVIDATPTGERAIFDERRRLEWDGERGDVVAVVERRLGAIRFAERRERPAPGDDTRAALLDRVRDTGLAALGWDGRSLRLVDRVRFLHHRHGEPWPDWSTDALVSAVDGWLGPYLNGLRSIAEVERLDLTTILRSTLEWPLGADIDRLAPEHLDLPNGRTAVIEYVDGIGEPKPSAHVRVQDLFGLDTHPQVGDVPLTLHLLSPADRPLQITADLPGFWRGAWAEVRREMAGRYPKHQWPIAPQTAEPRRLGKDNT